VGNLFGTDGVRGLANAELTVELALRIGRAAGHLLSQQKRERVLVGRDPRASGEMLEAGLVAGLCASGADVVRVGVMPTPGVAYLSRYLGSKAGAAVTASHNPAPENGIKFFGPDGLKLPDAVEEQIEGLIEDAQSLPAPTGGGVGRVHERPDLLHHYSQQVRHTIPHRLDGVRLVVDCANGATSPVAGEILCDLGADVVFLSQKPDGLNINADCGSLYPQRMMSAVIENGAGAGAAFDGDGDRVLMADEKGRLVDGDRIMALCALHWAGTYRLPGNIVVGTVMSNIGLELALKDAGITLLRAPVGDRYVGEEMRRVGAALGGEKSGHIIFAQHGTTGDGLVSLLQVLHVMMATGKPMSELADQVAELPQILVNVPVATKEGWSSKPNILAAIQDAEAALRGRGRVLVRPSGTERIIRVMAEGPEESELQRLVSRICDAIEGSLG
jgi:phosphoglucosamine mutase